MRTTQWDTSRDMNLLQDRMNKLFEESLARGKTTEEGSSGAAWSPPVDIYETADKIVLRADLPGVAQKDIDLRIEDNVLVLRGERKLSKEVSQEDFLRIERYYGSFQRVFRLPSTVDQAGVLASHEDGVLEVTIPKNEESRAKSIRVEVR